MSVALEAVIVGGSAALAVVLTEWLTRIRARTDVVQRSAREIAMTLPYVVVGMSEGATPVDTSLGSQWFEKRERVQELLGVVLVSVRWPQRRAARIRACAIDLIARTTAAEMDFILDGLRLPRSVAVDVMSSDLHAAVFGARKPLDKVIDSYRRGSVGRL